MKFKLPAALTFSTLLLTACFNSAPSHDTVIELLKQNGKEAAIAQASLFRAKPLTEEEKENLQSAFQDIQVSDCREDEETSSEYLCLVRMNVKPVRGPVVAVEEDVRIRKSKEGEWRVVASK